MKTYKEIINEFSPTDYVPDVLLPSSMKQFKKNFRTIERMYPGVHQFLSVANRWVFRGDRFQNTDLKTLLKRLKRRPDISDMKKADIKKIHDFIEKYNLRDIESIRNVFSDYSDFTKHNQDTGLNIDNE